MNITKTEFPGLLVLEPKVFGDERGYFMESYNKAVFEKLGLDLNFVQDNQAFSKSAQVLRGFHFQKPPQAMTKLVWVTQGRVIDAVVDLRHGSPTYGKCFHVELSAENHRRLLVPKGFGHAYLTLEENTMFQYKVDAYYAPELDAGVAYDDNDIGMDWDAFLGGGTPILSEKDGKMPAMADLPVIFHFEE